jgi:hypothetical protein
LRTSVVVAAAAAIIIMVVVVVVVISGASPFGSKLLPQNVQNAAA